MGIKAGGVFSTFPPGRFLLYNQREMSPKRKFDKFFATVLAILILVGFFLFVSASLSLLAKESGAKFSSIFFSQFVFGLAFGLVFLIVFSKIHYRKYKKYAFYIFLAALVASCLVFVPELGLFHGGARRWLSIAGVSFQPAEFLKFSFVIYFAAILASFKSKFYHWKFSILPALIILSVIAVISYFQPDFGTLLIIGITAVAMIFVSGIRFKHLVITGLLMAVCLTPLAFSKEYSRERILNFFNNSESAQNDENYQIEQSLIAIGSGGLFGKGFGKSAQKFGVLPEPMGDSIFAVTAEEWGFIGASLLVLLFFLFTWRGLRIASRAPDLFGRLLAVGFVILIASQSFINMGSMLHIFPIIGMPLLFISQGGTALLFALAEAGIILNVSKYQGSGG
ncbi:MAG: FtsW/RodA/SpoVE family cell cycle protein [Patescibacteria group bacterium]